MFSFCTVEIRTRSPAAVTDTRYVDCSVVDPAAVESWLQRSADSEDMRSQNWCTALGKCCILQFTATSGI